MLLINRGVPENNAHVVTLRLAESKHQGGAEIAPHVVRLDIGKQNVSVDRESDSQTETFPGNAVDDASVGGHTERTEMNTLCVVELYSSLVAFGAINQGASDGQDVAVGAPLAGLHEHAGVNELGAIVSEVLHKLHTATLINDGQLSSVLINVFITKALTI